MVAVVIGSVALSSALDRKRITHNLDPMDLDIVFDSEGSAASFMEKMILEDRQFKVIAKITSEKFNTRTWCVEDNGFMIELTYPLDDECTTAKFVEMVKNNSLEQRSNSDVGYISNQYGRFLVPSLDQLYTLKMSHRYLKNSNHFLKTLATIKNMRKIGAKIFDDEFYKARMKETYNYPHPKLNVGKKDFFNSNFQYIYDHDSIHEAIKILDKPAYTYYMDGEEEVNCSKDAFFSQEKHIQLLGVLEETYVLAIERSQIPNNFEIDPRHSFNLALEKVCTSITSGWFREYAWENFEVVSKLYDESYIHRFKNALNKGEVKKFGE